MIAKQKRLLQAATKALKLMEECDRVSYSADYIVRRKEWITTVERLKKAIALNEDTGEETQT